MTFGDAEPEDSWHPDDPVPEQIANLQRRVALLPWRRQVWPADPRQAVQALADVVAVLWRRRLEPADRVRLEGLDEDVRYLRGRV